MEYNISVHNLLDGLKKTLNTIYVERREIKIRNSYMYLAWSFLLIEEGDISVKGQGGIFI